MLVHLMFPDIISSYNLVRLIIFELWLICTNKILVKPGWYDILLLPNDTGGNQLSSS